MSCCCDCCSAIKRRPSSSFPRAARRGGGGILERRQRHTSGREGVRGAARYMVARRRRRRRCIHTHTTRWNKPPPRFCPSPVHGCLYGRRQTIKELRRHGGMATKERTAIFECPYLLSNIIAVDAAVKCEGNFGLWSSLFNFEGAEENRVIVSRSPARASRWNDTSEEHTQHRWINGSSVEDRRNTHAG